MYIYVEENKIIIKKVTLEKYMTANSNNKYVSLTYSD